MRGLAALLGAVVIAGMCGVAVQALPVTELSSETPKAAKDAPKPAQPDQPAAPSSNAPEDEQKPLPDIITDMSKLPAPVQAMRQRILDAVLSGDPEKLRTAIEVNETPPAFSFGEQGDPIAAMKKQSNDGEGREIMAILAEVLEAGALHVDKGTPQEIFIWPYFAQYPLEKLTPPQIIDLFRIVTAYEFNEMKEFGAYNFYRAGISPDGVWHFFITGD